jgi:GDPmannose 4,6-dehydratase
MTKRAVITGLTGQDGSYLAEQLLALGYEVFGLIRRHSITEHQQSRIEHLDRSITKQYGDVLDPGSIARLLVLAQPHEIYHLAGQSHVRVSFDLPHFTVQVNTLGTLNVLEAMRLHAPEARYYQASSSEMFGSAVDADGRQRETTPMHPVSPYGCSKLASYHLVRAYRAAYGLWAANGILFNHESPRRGANFVTQKIVKNAVRIARGGGAPLALGNLDAQRDWGHAQDYVRAMHAILQHDHPDEFVIATGETQTVREWCDQVFGRLGLDYRDHVVQQPRFLRAQELPYLCGDSQKARTVLGWAPTVTFSTLITELLDAELARTGGAI